MKTLAFDVKTLEVRIIDEGLVFVVPIYEKSLNILSDFKNKQARLEKIIFLKNELLELDN